MVAFSVAWPTTVRRARAKKRWAAFISCCLAQHRVDHVPVGVDSAIQIAPPPVDLDIVLVAVPLYARFAAAWHASARSAVGRIAPPAPAPILAEKFIRTRCSASRRRSDASGSRKTSLSPGPLRTVRTRRRVHGSSKPRAQPSARGLMSRAADDFGVPVVDLMMAVQVRHFEVGVTVYSSL